ncbi:CLUMA_CG017189, isoform A [Clunio marinus]|uniref:CLUMA_CG017189, isoform A n=1 Tax=Clunio marinus TaxID=568069 RepID=A0A1J1IWZ5_9DIPT|nr:CLUMA_CG017189, isoform A [Clunio marinus]
MFTSHTYKIKQMKAHSVVSWTWLGLAKIKAKYLGFTMADGIEVEQMVESRPKKVVSTDQDDCKISMNVSRHKSNHADVK